jgi:hypothetical protein
MQTPSGFRFADWSAWLEKYAAGEFEQIVPTLKDAPMEDLVVDLLASGMGGTEAELCDLLLSSFTGVTYWTPKLSQEELHRALQQAIDLCVDGGLAERAEGRLAITDLGHACASKGIGVRTTVALASWVLTVAAFSPAGVDVYVSMPKDERWKMGYWTHRERARSRDPFDRHRAAGPSSRWHRSIILIPSIRPTGRKSRLQLPTRS